MTPSAILSPAEKPLSGSYILPHAEPEIERLNAQHYMLVGFLGDEIIAKEAVQYLQQVSLKEGNVKVLDVATGTGVWLSTARSHLESLNIKASLFGYDYSDSKFPSKSSADSLAEFGLWDVLQPPPSNLAGQFDYVHVRLLMGGLDHDQWDTAAENISALLKPGAYLDWTDIVTSRMTARPKTAITEEALNKARAIFQLMGKDNGAAANIAPLLSRHGINVHREFHSDGFSNVAAVQNPQNEIIITGLDHAFTNFFEKAPRALSQKIGWESVDEIKELIGKIRKEVTHDQVDLGYPVIRVIGQK